MMMQTPPPDRNESTLILDNLVELTSQREQEMLESSLLSTLVEVMNVDRIELFACRWINNAPYIRRRLEAHAGHGKPTIRATPCDGWLPPPVFLYNLLNQLDGLDRSDGIHRIPGGLCLPLRCMGNIISLLFIHHSNEAKTNRSMLKAMARIHENFLRLLLEADRDMLTALNNRRKFDQYIYSLLTSLQQQTSPPPYILALLDIDMFKHVNDQYGHIVGDEVLLLMAQLMQQSFREEDGLFRYGGEEFALLLQGSDIEQTEMALDRFRATVSRFPFPQIKGLTISVGYTLVNPMLLPGLLVEQADRALYYAKTNGRNQVCSYERLVAENKLEPLRVDGQVDLF